MKSIQGSGQIVAMLGQIDDIIIEEFVLIPCLLNKEQQPFFSLTLLFNHEHQESEW